ncbi:MAG: hypothetical protein QOG23_3699 [Blastocatellia bacterium]|jgi:hypothetical protein|nr:hypothetical protein [Blastocatellia bacterium]
MIGDFGEITLGPEAIEYIKDRLARGKTLASLLLEHRDLDGGDVVTFLPSNADFKRIRNFSEGGVLPTPPSETHQHYTTPDGTKTVLVPVPGTNSHLVTTIQEFLKQGEGRICLFESAVARPTDGFLSSPNAQDLRVLTCENDVYYFLTEDGLDRKKINKTVSYAISYLVIGVLAQLSKVDKFLPIEQNISRGEITLYDLRLLTEKTQKIIVGAYDGEGYLIWSDNQELRR